MARSFGIILSAVLLLLGGLLILLVGALMLGVFWGSLAVEVASEAKKMLFLAPVVLLAMAVWAICTAVGLFQRRHWARTSTLIIAGLVTFFGLVSIPSLLLVHAIIPEEASPPTMSKVLKGVGFFYASMAAVGGWGLYFFTRERVKDLFAGSGVPLATGPTRPLSITVVAWWFLLGVSWFPLTIVMGLPAAFLTLVVIGWKAGLIMGLYALVQLCLGIGLLKGVPWSRTLAVYYFAFGVLHMLVFEFFPGREERWAALMSSLPPGSQTVVERMQEPIGLAILPEVALTAAIAIWFLVTRKKAFLAYAEARRAARESVEK